ncbi:MAG TPA: hypothetical protein VKT77_14335 [Chthonomonadaceae bacterium]|nr:hypothetical protein [Chthonomonadaceae bacterium]
MSLYTIATGISERTMRSISPAFSISLNACDIARGVTPGSLARISAKRASP